MAVKVNHSKCIGCAGCVGACPVLALTLEENRLSCDASKCVDCGACIKICPFGALSKEGSK